MKIFFSVGEPSGDLHGANLIRELQKRNPEMQFVGFGGPRMNAAGCQLLVDLTELAVMGFLLALINLHKFWPLYQQAKRYFREQRPDAVVLIDYPGFNWWVARAAKREGIPVFYYGVPQMWAWGGWRVRKMQRLVDHVLCKLPFEKDWFEQRGCQATFVGHPYFDQLAEQKLDTEFLRDYGQRREPLVLILPGSRTQEVTNNLEGFLKTASLIQRRMPTVRFAIASFSERQAELAMRMVAESTLSVDVFVGRTPELIQLSHCCLACSGSVSLELLYHAKPSLILYTVQKFMYKLARRVFMKVKFITLVNLLSAENPFLAPGELYDQAAARDDSVILPEYLTFDDASREMAEHMLTWLKDDAIHKQRIDRLEALKNRLVTTGASNQAAEYILAALDDSPSTLPGPGYDQEGMIAVDRKSA